MRILFVSSEIYPLAKTGGLADVGASLPAALTNLGVEVRLMMPAYAGAKAALRNAGPPIDIGMELGQGPIRLIPGTTPDTHLPIWLVDCPALYERPGRLYTDEHGVEWPDNAIRYAVLSRAAVRVALGTKPLGWRPDVVHCHDWHTGLVPAFLRASGRDDRPATLFTVHNMAFQGNFPASVYNGLDLPDSYFAADGMEFYQQVSFLKAGLRFSDLVTTVSPTYAEEVMTPAFGAGLEGVVQSRTAAFSGILNGADYGVWDPAHDPYTPAHYDSRTLARKQMCKQALMDEMDLFAAGESDPLIAYMSRLTDQKMADVLLDAAPRIVEEMGALVIHAEGDPGFETDFLRLAERYPGRIAVRIGYEEALAHRMLAGSDILLAPARYEPCGLTQMYAMRYGTIPVVRRTGGLADTVVDLADAHGGLEQATGIVFDEVSSDGLQSAVHRAVELFRQPIAWRHLQINAMTGDFSWERSAACYLDLYRTALLALTEPDATLEPVLSAG